MTDTKSILFSSGESDTINQLVQTKIASHLFLTCNYAPSPYLMLSEDAKFVVGILNLYKFTVDGSIIERIPSIADVTVDSKFNKKEFLKKLELVKALRTVFCHNESEISGNNEDIKRVDAWMSKVPQNIEDYRVLNQQLLKLASDILVELQQFVKNASRSKRKKILIDNWEGVIKTFYQRPNTRKILEGQLKKFYSARKGILSMDKITSLNMAACVRKYYIGDLESNLEEKNNCMQISKKLNLPVEELVKFKKLVEAVEEELNERKKQIVTRLGNSRITMDNIDRNDYPYLELYIKELPQRIIKFIDTTPDTNVYGTLLPQDIVQYIIKQDFDLIIK